MLFRYDFGDKLDLLRFKKQAPHYIKSMRETTFHFYLLNYKMIVEIAKPDVGDGNIVSLHFYDLTRDAGGDIIMDKIIYPLSDTRFSEIKYFKELFYPGLYKANFVSNDSVKTVEKISDIIKLLFKINKLKVFL